jgi:hypothetical protein
MDLAEIWKSLSENRKVLINLMSKIDLMRIKVGEIDV